jgi:hypothetical protein
MYKHTQSLKRTTKGKATSQTHLQANLKGLGHELEIKYMDKDE